MRQKLLLAIISLIVFLVVFEAAARIFLAFFAGPEKTALSRGWQAEFFKSFLDWHESDPELLWRFKAGLDNPLIKTNSDHLLGDPIPAQKDENCLRILLLGDSSPVGLGLTARNLAFGEQLKYFLELQYLGGKKIELINAAVSGYTSEQIKRFLRLKGWAYNPDLIILYCGNNDASISGPLSDRELLESQKLVGLRKALSHLAIYRLMRDLLTGSQKETSAETPLKVRVSPDEYYENMNDIADQCREHNCPLIICKPPVPLLWPAGLQFKALAHISGESGELIFPEKIRRYFDRKIEYCLDSALYHDLYGKGDVFTQMVYGSAYVNPLPPDSALQQYLKQSGLTPASLNNTGVAHWKLKQYDKAEGYFQLARATFMAKYEDSLNDGRIAAGSPFLFNIGMNHLYMDSSFIPLSRGVAEGTHAEGRGVLSDTAALHYLYLDSALQADYFSLRIKRTYLDMINEFQNQPGVTIVDLPEIFRNKGGERLYIDHCHPTAEGHRLIAQELHELITRMGL